VRGVHSCIGMARRADDSWEDWEEAADVPELPRLPAAGAAAPAVDDKFAGEDEGEDAPEHDVPQPQQVRPMRGDYTAAILSLSRRRTDGAGRHGRWYASQAHIATQR
jgi:hypothetical protein